LREAGISTEVLRSKAWDVFALPDAPPMDLVITVCDSAAGEQCPFWPGHPATAHWGYADPSAVQGSDAQRLDAFRRTLAAIRLRLELLVSIPAGPIDRLALQGKARDLASS
jgi:protein-tyrosine-phosphatase